MLHHIMDVDLLLLSHNEDLCKKKIGIREKFDIDIVTKVHNRLIRAQNLKGDVHSSK